MILRGTNCPGLPHGVHPLAGAAFRFLPQSTAPSVESLTVMDKWITSIKGSTSEAAIEAKVVAAKPTEAFDFCYLFSDKTFSTKVTDIDMCDADARLQFHASPRQVAGGPVSENILKCELKPLNPADYLPATFTSEQWARLHAAFPTGSCDFNRPAVGEQPSEPWMTFMDGLGVGRPLGPPPVSGMKR